MQIQKRGRGRPKGSKNKVRSGRAFLIAEKSSLRKKSITEDQIKTILKLREELEAFQKKTKETAEVLNGLEKNVYDLLIKGASTDRLPWQVLPKIIERRFVKWKEVFIHYKSQKLADKIIEKTKPVKYFGISIYKKAKII